MARSCPSCHYGPIGPFIDNCPMCAAPVRNSSGRLARPTTPKQWLLVAGIVGVVFLLYFGINHWPRNRDPDEEIKKMVAEMKAQMEAERRARTVAISAAGLLREFERDADAADKKYKGKCLEVTGVVERVGSTEVEGPFAILHAGDDAAKLKIECYFFLEFDGDEFPPSDSKPKLENGQTATVRGDYNGRVSHVKLRACTIVKE